MVEAIVGWGFRVGSGILCLVADMFGECFGRAGVSPTDTVL